MVATSADRVRLVTCADACEWAGPRGGPLGASREEYRRAWDECERGDWLLRIARRRGVDLRLIVRAACSCAREALRYVPAGEDRPRIAIDTVERWCDGQVPNIEDVRAAREAVWQCRRELWRDGAAGAVDYAADAAAAAAYAAGAATDYAAADAARAAIDAADAAADADANAAGAAVYAAAAAYAAGDAHLESYKRAADIVRSVITFDLIDPLI